MLDTSTIHSFSGGNRIFVNLFANINVLSVIPKNSFVLCTCSIVLSCVLTTGQNNLLYLFVYLFIH